MDKKSKNANEDDIQFTGEDNIDEPQIVDIEEGKNNKISKLKEKLKTCEEDRVAQLEELQRTKADFLNSKKRLEEQGKLNNERNQNNFIQSLLPLCDSFDMAISNKDVWESVDENWRNGVEAIQNQLHSILKQHNVTEMKVAGESFDPNRHEAMSTIDGEGKSETIVEVLQKGYERNGMVLRPAKVIIQN